MKRDTKQKILDAAKELFNQRGYNAVSIGDIADALEISKGNLTYYFKRKEDILAALLASMPTATPLAPAATLEELDEYFRKVQEVVQENAFYFWHRTQFGQIFPSIKKKQQNIYGQNVAHLQTALQNLRTAGLLREDAYPGEGDRTIDTLLLAAMYWIPFRELTQSPERMADYAAQAWSILHPLLKDKGLNALSQLLSFP